MNVAAWAHPIRHACQFSARRAAGRPNHSTIAAIPDRYPATCQLDTDAALIAAPPVENSSAVANNISLFDNPVNSIQGSSPLKISRTAPLRSRLGLANPQAEGLPYMPPKMK